MNTIINLLNIINNFYYNNDDKYIQKSSIR